ARSRGAGSRSSRSATSYIGPSHVSSPSVRARETMRRTATAPRSSHPAKRAATSPHAIRNFAAADNSLRAGATSVVGAEAASSRLIRAAGAGAATGADEDAIGATVMLGRIGSGNGDQDDTAGTRSRAASVPSHTRYRAPAGARRSPMVMPSARIRSAVAFATQVRTVRISDIVTSRSRGPFEYGRAAFRFRLR